MFQLLDPQLVTEKIRGLQIILHDKIVSLSSLPRSSLPTEEARLILSLAIAARYLLSVGDCDVVTDDVELTRPEGSKLVRMWGHLYPSPVLVTTKLYRESIYLVLLLKQ